MLVAQLLRRVHWNWRRTGGTADQWLVQLSRQHTSSVVQPVHRQELLQRLGRVFRGSRLLRAQPMLDRLLPVAVRAARLSHAKEKIRIPQAAFAL
jgi:hypothetical protein